VGPDLGRKAANGSYFEIAAGMWNHSPAMAERMSEFHMSRPTFEENALADLAAFLYFLKYFDEPGDPRVGKTLFTEKHCIRCHQVGSQGGDTAPRLDSLPRTVSPLRIVQDLWNHGPTMVTAMEMQGLDAPSFEGSELIDLLAYLRSQGQREEAPEFQSAGEHQKGRRVFEAKGCNRCHAMFGNGPQVGPDLGSAELRGSVTQIAGRMWNHWPAMAQAMRSIGMPRPEFQRDELADLFAYIFIARYEGQAGDALRGREVYRTNGCADCHRQEGKGGIGPPLNEIAASGTTKESITRRMWNHGPAMWEKMRDGRIPWPRFSSQELADLLTFLATARN
jgi:cytochrome c2